ncbi:MAG: transglycosylase domain-containing protein, partial [Anaerolineales bacterium]|nr:transglycosylase domain-containing protein [Anaerolineales bacterium]
MIKKFRRPFLLICGVVLFTTAALAYWLFHDLPSPASITDQFIVPSVRITDRHGRLLYDVIDADNGRHLNLPLEQIPTDLINATIATEDRNFYSNPGVDIEGIMRAFWINVQGGEVIAGGSTITQQVTRNLLLPDERGERTVKRKLRESWLAWRVARVFEKDRILAMYLNQSYYGGLAYGVEAAAQTYFGKTAADLTLAESALLAGLPQTPALYNPLIDPQAAKERQEVVLGLMLKEGYITQEEHDIALYEPLQYAAEPYPILAPHFVMMVQAQLDGLY